MDQLVKYADFKTRQSGKSKTQEEAWEDPLSSARFANKIGQITLFIIMLVFNVGFWSVAMFSYTRSIQDFYLSHNEYYNI